MLPASHRLALRASALSLLALGTGVGVHAARAAAAGPSQGDDTWSHPGHPLIVTGTVEGRTTPGTPSTVTITIRNPNNQAVVVEKVTASVEAVTSRDTSGPACRTDWFDVGRFDGSLLVDRRQSGQVQLALTLRDEPAVNQDRCQGSTVSLAFTARARRA